MTVWRYTGDALNGTCVTTPPARLENILEAEQKVWKSQRMEQSTVRGCGGHDRAIVPTNSL